MKKNSKISAVLRCTGFIALFLAILTLLTLVYVPKWEGRDSEEMRGFYQEAPGSIDILCLGSCNMYSSFSPVIAYEQHGLTSYVFGCPDQELVISYHYLKEALKTQDIKLVVLESLFLTCEPTGKREYYNRTALEYMEPSLNKAQLILELGAMESEYMQTVDASAPDTLLTYAGYFFPLLRYHGREDLTMDDVTFHFQRDDYSENKGGLPLFSYLNNETLDFAYVLNGEAIRDTSREYFIKIQELCAQEGIELLLVKSPNHFRWDEPATQAVTAFAAERNVNFVDFDTFGDFRRDDYSSTTGRLNVYGMKRFTEHLSQYILENYDIGPHDLSPENAAKWDACVESFHAKANDAGMTIDEGQIYRIYNEAAGIRLLWNRALDADSYVLYRKVEDGEFEKVATLSECAYLDTDVTHGTKYTYRVQPENGALADTVSNESQYMFVAAPLGGTAKNRDGTVQLAWEPATEEVSYHIQRKSWDALGYSYWDTTQRTTYRNLSCKKCVAYNYRIRAMIQDGEQTYYSGAIVLSAIPIPTPAISTMSATSGGNTFRWSAISGGDSYEIYRRAAGEAEFTHIDTISGKRTSYTDKNVEDGVQYFYKIVLTKSKAGIDDRSDYSNTVGIVTRLN